ncbi:MAG: phosphatase PAP2 family protein [Candidatus Sungbacteria bacterium]|uniref:Phosphatase PAP2 family protein n=1 Tax=Candidatus Sungiibacteriota bacterium TaxID=2750080 RepID=A0A932YXH1_9BACT|nr:phosphatase PAP2 family protein [Candidatus Sungbacteria bacterium]
MLMLYQYDLALLLWLNSWAFQSERWDTLVVFLVEWLPYWFIAGLVAFGVLAFLPRYRESLRRNWEIIFVAFGAGIISRYGAAEIIRAFYNRPRPFESLTELNELVLHDGGGSFPSGHASFYFALAAVISRYYPRTSILFYIAAILLTGARVAAGIHWPLDILGGAVIGITVGLLVHSILAEIFRKKK